MARRALTFKQADVSRAVKGVAAAGVKVMRVEVDPSGKITVVTAEGANPPAGSPLDDWMARRGAR